MSEYGYSDLIGAFFIGVWLAVLAMSLVQTWTTHNVMADGFCRSQGYEEADSYTLENDWFETITCSGVVEEFTFSMTFDKEDFDGAWHNEHGQAPGDAFEPNFKVGVRR